DRAGAGLRPRVVLVDARTAEQVGAGAAADLLLDGVEPVVQEAGRRAADRLARAPARRVVGERGRRAAVDRAELVARVPLVAVRAVVGQVAVQVVAHGRAVPAHHLVRRIIRRRAGRWRRQAGPRVGAGQGPLQPRAVVAVAQIAEGRAAQRVGQARELPGGIVAIADDDAVGEREGGAAAAGVVGE